ncbi:murein biosynthesis integral membrane protein MurJ [bacterium]|nr:murein biosynthesis integral membrane protein MurJ [bacterium]
MRGRIKRLFGENTVFQASLILSFFILVARILGLIRDRLFAAQFGAGSELDTFFAAFRLPDLIFNLVIIGSFSAAFIPVFMEVKLKKDEKEGWRLVSILLNLLIFLWIACALVVFIFAPYFVKLIVPGFSGEQLSLTAHLTRILLLSPLFLGLSNVAGSTLNAYKRFFLTALAPSLYNLGIIIGALVFAPSKGVIGLAWGVILGAVLHFLVQWIGLFQLRFRYFFDFNFWHPKAKEVIFLAIPRMLATSVYQLNLWIQTFAASYMAGGAISVLNFGQNIQSLPVGLVGVALSSAIFPTLTEIAFYGQREKMRLKIIKALRMILFIILPLTLFLIVLRAQAVRVILGAGHFDWLDTYLTAKVVGYFAVSLFAQCFILLLNQVFFALKDTWTPFKISFLSFIVNSVLIFLFTARLEFLPRLGPEGVALAFSLAAFFQACLLILKLKGKIGDFVSELWSFGFKVLVLSLLAAVFVQVIKTFLGEVLDLQYGLNVLIQGGAAFVVGAIVFLLLAKLFDLSELKEFKGISAKII